jgi:chemotaxis protein CheZ
MRERASMAFQRKVFRIEERARLRAPDAASADEAEGAIGHHAFMAELQALRALIAPRVQMDRETIERVRAQIAEAEAYKNEIELIYKAVKRSKDEIDVVGAEPLQGDRVARASRDLQAIVAGTEQATQTILQAAEEIERSANTLADTLKSGPDQGLAHDIQDRVVQIFEACNFQDLTGQRVAKVVATLKFIEDHAARLLQIWRSIEQFKPVVFGADDGRDTGYLDGPKLPEEPGHSTQDDIDAIFRCAKAG